MSEFPLPESETCDSPSLEIVNSALSSLKGEPYHQKDINLSMTTVEVNFVPYLVSEVGAYENPDASKEALHLLSNYLYKRAEMGLMAINAPSFLSLDNLPDAIRNTTHRATGQLPSSPIVFAELILDSINLQFSKSTEWRISQNINQWSTLTQQLLADLYEDQYQTVKI